MRQLDQSHVAEIAHLPEIANLSFDGLSLVGSDLANKVIENCSFRTCILTDVRFNASTIHGCDFAEAGIQGVSLFAATVSECKMMGLEFSRGARLDGATFDKTNLDYAHFRNTDLSNIEFVDCSMRECDLTGADLSNATMVNCDLTDVDWSNVTTRSTDLRGSILRGLDLRRGPYGVILTTGQLVALAGDLGIGIVDPAE